MGTKNKNINNIVANFSQILEFAKGYGLLIAKKRAVLREYLQMKLIDLIYQEKISTRIFFIGGTALRLLHGLDRFSEDLDFDTDKISDRQILDLMEGLSKRLQKEQIAVSLYKNTTPKRSYFELRFTDLLFQLNLSKSKQEKLVIKFDFESFWQGQNRKVTLLKKYGFIINIVSIPLDQILVQKLHAYINRRQTMPRDLYDIVWLWGQEAKADLSFIKKNKLPKELVTKAIEKWKKEKKILSTAKRKLRPFLINEQNVNRLEMFESVLEKILFYPDAPTLNLVKAR